LPEVNVGPNESFEQALKRFSKLVQQTGVLAEARRREHYEPPSVRLKKKRAAKLRKSRKNSGTGRNGRAANNSRTASNSRSAGNSRSSRRY